MRVFLLLFLLSVALFDEFTSIQSKLNGSDKKTNARRRFTKRLGKTNKQLNEGDETVDLDRLKQIQNVEACMDRKARLSKRGQHAFKFSHTVKAKKINRKVAQMRNNFKVHRNRKQNLGKLRKQNRNRNKLGRNKKGKSGKKLSQKRDARSKSQKLDIIHCLCKLFANLDNLDQEGKSRQRRRGRIFLEPTTTQPNTTKKTDPYSGVQPQVVIHSIQPCGRLDSSIECSATNNPPFVQLLKTTKISRHE